MGLLSNRVERGELEIGDHIYSWRTVYSYAHHGIYVGKGKVVHFTRGENSVMGTNTFIDSFITSWWSSHRKSSGPCESCGDDTRNGVVCSCLDCFLCGDPLYRFEYGKSTAEFLFKSRGGTCTQAESDQPSVVVKRVECLLQYGFGRYHVLQNNCEDFAMYCKTGFLAPGKKLVGLSGQVAASLWGAPIAAAVGIPLFIGTPSWGMVATASAAIYYTSRYVTDLGIRRDAVKVQD